MLKIIVAALAALLALAAPALAQTTKPGAHGGQVRMADHHAIEFVSTDREIAFYVLEEDGKPLDTKGLTGRAIIQEGGKSTTVALAAAAPNKLAGPLAAPLGKGARIVMTSRVHGHALQARFEQP
ncbi:hypothetical protein [uncultured Enterovirga sp.]|uniref:hypothetical protein n=1 Tax=uncultured Enterovirga sp. TaxID=2026352 RepID=UPI0035CC4942